MGLPSGKHTKNYGTSPFLMGKSTISTRQFSIAMLNDQRVWLFAKVIVGMAIFHQNLKFTLWSFKIADNHHVDPVLIGKSSYTWTIFHSKLFSSKRVIPINIPMFVGESR